ncbi:MAG: DUF642 domain-containing protein [Phycisphaerales bacterium]|nr:DUF642 domain-containing protein [Phycisphaerales bacterium]
MRALLICLVSSASSVATAQNLLVNGGFEAPNAGGSFTSRSGDFGPGNGWSIGGAIDHIGGFWAAADGFQSVDLNSASAGSVFQSFPTTPGRVYRIRYAASENFFGFADKTMTVSWNSGIIESVRITHDPLRTTTNMKWVYRTLHAHAASTTSTLAFISTTGSMPGSQGNTAFYGPAIDDVSVEQSGGCPGDLNNDAQVDDSDFVLFAAGYNTLDCADPAMPAGCPADLNADGTVEDLDFQVFVVAYNELLCP